MRAKRQKRTKLGRELEMGLHQALGYAQALAAAKAERIAALRKELAELSGCMVVLRDRKRHNATQPARTRRYRAKLKARKALKASHQPL